MATLQQVVDYIKQHKENYPVNVLWNELLKQNIPEATIDEAVKIATGQEAAPVEPPQLSPSAPAPSSPATGVSTPASPMRKLAIVGVIGILALVVLFGVLMLRGRSEWALSPEQRQEYAALRFKEDPVAGLLNKYLLPPRMEGRTGKDMAEALRYLSFNPNIESPH